MWSGHAGKGNTPLFANIHAGIFPVKWKPPESQADLEPTQESNGAVFMRL
jgi:hypothetical protein